MSATYVKLRVMCPDIFWEFLHPKEVRNLATIEQILSYFGLQRVIF